MNKWRVIIISSFAIVCGVIFTFIMVTHPEEKLNNVEKDKSGAKKVTETKTPTIFVHGYGGTKNSFGSMIDRLQKQNGATPSLVMTVKRDGHLITQGRFYPESNKPLIQILFEDNKSTLTNQANWLKQLLQKLKQTYHIKKINAVGHSMGGVSLVSYLEQTAGDKNYPTLKKLVLIGSPLNGLVIGENGITDYDLTDEGPKRKTERFTRLMADKEKIPKDLEVFTIAGDTLDGRKSDGSVSVASALSAKFIFTHVANYKAKVFKGEKAKHGNLHENPEVDAVVDDFLFTNSTK